LDYKWRDLSRQVAKSLGANTFILHLKVSGRIDDDNIQSFLLFSKKTNKEGKKLPYMSY
jgi:hypothetical protein